MALALASPGEGDPGISARTHTRNVAPSGLCSFPPTFCKFYICSAGSNQFLCRHKQLALRHHTSNHILQKPLTRIYTVDSPVLSSLLCEWGSCWLTLSCSHCPTALRQVQEPAVQPAESRTPPTQSARFFSQHSPANRNSLEGNVCGKSAWLPENGPQGRGRTLVESGSYLTNVTKVLCQCFFLYFIKGQAANMYGSLNTVRIV